MAVLKNIVSKIFNLNTTPAKKTEGQFWYDTTNNVLKRSDGTDYKPLPVGDNLISAGSTDTVKGILNSKANASDLDNYLSLTGGTITGKIPTILTISGVGEILGPMAPAQAGLLIENDHFSDNTPDADLITLQTFYGSDSITGAAVTDSIISGSNKLLTSGGAYTALQSKANDADVVKLTGDQVIAGTKNFYEPSKYANRSVAISSDKIKVHYIEDDNYTEIKPASIELNNGGLPDRTLINESSINMVNSYGSSCLSPNVSYNSFFVESNVALLHSNGAATVDGNAFYGTAIIGTSNTDDTNEYGVPTINTTSNIILFKVGIDLVEGSTSISGEVVDKSISSSSLDTHIPTSKAVYTSLTNKQDKLSYYSEAAYGDGSTHVSINAEDVTIGQTNTTIQVTPYFGIEAITINSVNGVNGTAIATTLGTSTTSSKLPTEGAVVNAINTSLANKQDKLSFYQERTSPANIAAISAEYINLEGSNGTSIEVDGYNYQQLIFNSEVGVSGTAVVSTLGTSTTSSKLPTEGAVVKAISDVKTSLGSALTYEGSVENYANLPTGLTASDKGKVYNVVNANGNIPAGTNYAWNGTSWDPLGGDYTALKDYVDDSLDDKITKNTDAELNAVIMPTYNSSGVQNGKAKIILYKDDTTGAITIEAEEIIE